MRKNSESVAAVLFFLPFFILFMLFTIIPVLMAVGLSMTNYSILQGPIFVWFHNYVFLFTQDDLFLTALRNTMYFALFSGPIGFAVSFMVAWVIDTLKFRKLYALAFYAPSITSGVAMSVVWLAFFAPNALGQVNYYLIQYGFISSPILWTQDPSKVQLLVIFISVWMGMGNGFLAFLAGFQNLDQQIFEAGRIDGVGNKFQELIYIVIPQQKPMLLFGAINTITGSFGIYDIPNALAAYPGPQNATMTLVGHMNDYAFTRLDMGYASTIAVVLFLMTFLIGRIVFRMLSTRNE